MIACDHRTPDTAKMDLKTEAIKSKDVLRRVLEGIQVDVEATNYKNLYKETGTYPLLALSEQTISY